MSAKTVSDIELTRALVKLEEDILRVHDMHPADALVDQHLGLALMHVRKARGSRVLPPNTYAKGKK
jgi:hypothetical protein